MRQDSRHYLTINIAKSNILQYWLIHSSLHCPMITLHVSWQSDQWNTRVLEKWKQLSLIKSKVNIQNTLSSLIFGPYIYASAQLLPVSQPRFFLSFIQALSDCWRTPIFMFLRALCIWLYHSRALENIVTKPLQHSWLCALGHSHGERRIFALVKGCVFCGAASPQGSLYIWLYSTSLLLPANPANNPLAWCCQHFASLQQQY